MLAASSAQAGKTKVCVVVNLQKPAELPAPPPLPGERAPRGDGESPPGEAAEAASRPAAEQPGQQHSAMDLSLIPLGQTPVEHLKRLIEHFVTHEEGFIAVRAGCKQRVHVDLYPLREGWTVFIRYSGHGREERVEQLLPDELSQFAERAVVALLHNRPISTTIKRDTVLRADTRVPRRWVGGTHHVGINLGTQLRVGQIPAVQDDGAVKSEVRPFSMLSFKLGYRGKFENWGIASTVGVGIGTGKTALTSNARGGHVDLGGNASIALHFLRYFNPRGVTSFYLGTGGTFELLWFWAIKEESKRTSDADGRNSLLGGGVDLDLVFGWEFMRATSVHWLIQGELHFPAYVLENENADGAIHSWFPGASLWLGVLF